MQLDEQALAIADYDAVIAIEASSAETFNDRGLAHRRIGNFEQAIADATVVRGPWWILFRVGDLICYRKQPDKVGLVLERWSLAIGHVWIILWRDGKQTEEFEQEIKKVEKVEPESK